MKMNVEIECTPVEAREFLGLPNVQPMQEAMMKKFEEKMLDHMQSFSPDKIMQSWFSFDPQKPEQFLKLFSNLFPGGTSKSG